MNQNLFPKPTKKKFSKAFQRSAERPFKVSRNCGQAKQLQTVKRCEKMFSEHIITQFVKQIRLVSADK